MKIKITVDRKYWEALLSRYALARGMESFDPCKLPESFGAQAGKALPKQPGGRALK